MDPLSDTLNCGACANVCILGPCIAGACWPCFPDGMLCGGQCVDPATDSANCGACGNACPPGATCKNAVCKSICQPNEAYCGGACVDVANNPMNCGSCGVVCGPGQSCNNGGCGCPPPTVSCSGVCTDVASDASNCGSCGVTCPGIPCVNGVCAPPCPPGQIKCGATCVNPLTSLQHCGGCNQGCAVYKTCSSGVCVPVCGVGETVCGGACVNLQIDPTSCGACGNACSPGLSCVGGACGCPSGEVLCGGACIDPANDPVHCGASGACQGAGAGVACAAGQVCVNGLCAATCSAGATVCGNQCVDLQIDNAHCGSCNSACSAGSACVDGACVVAGPLYLVTTLNSDLYTVDRATGQMTPAQGLINTGPAISLTHDRRNGMLYVAAGLLEALHAAEWHNMTWSADIHLLAHDWKTDQFYGQGKQAGVPGFWRWSPLGANLGAVSPPPAPMYALTADARHRRLYALAGTGLYRYDMIAATWALVADTGFDWGPQGGYYQASLAYDPSIEALYVTHWSDVSFGPGALPSTFRKMNPKTGASTVITTASTRGPIALAVQGDGAQCLPGDIACGPFPNWCDPYEICVSIGAQTPTCMPADTYPDYCPTCPAPSCPQGTTCAVQSQDSLQCY